MSDSMMSIDEAQMWVQQDKSTRSTPRASRTIVAQAEQIRRLQKVVQSHPEWREFITNGWLLPGDMKNPA